MSTKNYYREAILNGFPATVRVAEHHKYVIIADSRRVWVWKLSHKECMSFGVLETTYLYDALSPVYEGGKATIWDKDGNPRTYENPVVVFLWRHSMEVVMT